MLFETYFFGPSYEIIKSDTLGKGILSLDQMLRSRSLVGKCRLNCLSSLLLILCKNGRWSLSLSAALRESSSKIGLLYNVLKIRENGVSWLPRRHRLRLRLIIVLSLRNWHRINSRSCHQGWILLVHTREPVLLA